MRNEESDLQKSVAELTLYLTQAEPAREPEGEREFLHVQHGRTHFPILCRQMIERATSSLTIVGDRLLLARLRVYEDLVNRLAALSTAIRVRILVPENSIHQIDGRRVAVDELGDQIRQVPLSLGDVCVVVRDQEEYFMTRFLPNDLHPSKGADRVVVSREREFAALWARLAGAAWEAGRPLFAKNKEVQST